jgi:hypothetical protein
MDSKKRLYIGDFLAEGSSKAVFKVGASVWNNSKHASHPSYRIETNEHNFILSPTELKNIFVEVDPSINTDDVVVARSELYDYINYVKTINAIKLHLMFAKSGNAPQIYGILFFLESKTQRKYLIKPLDINNVEYNIELIDFDKCFISMFVFQEKCINDLKTRISNIYGNITKISSKNQDYNLFIDTFLNNMVDEEITEHLDKSVENYVDTLQTIELDYKPANICLQKISASSSASASVSASASSGSYKWTSFDYDMNYTRKFGEIPEDLITSDGKSIKAEFAKYAKLYMKIMFFVLLSYIFKTNQTSGKIKQISDKIKTILSEKIQNMYGIRYDTILETLRFFNEFGLNRKYASLKIFTGKYTPEYMLDHYARHYFDYSVILPQSIIDTYNNALDSKERLTILICYILQIPTATSYISNPLETTSLISDIPILKQPDNNTQPQSENNNTQPTTPPQSENNNTQPTSQQGGRRRKKSKKKKQTKRRKTKHVKK